MESVIRIDRQRMESVPKWKRSRPPLKVMGKENREKVVEKVKVKQNREKR